MIRIVCCYIYIICAYYIRNDDLKKRHYGCIQHFLTVMIKISAEKERKRKEQQSTI